MFNKYNRKKDSLTNGKSTSSYNTNTVDVEVVSEYGNTDHELLIVDTNGILVSFPKNLIKANDLKIRNGQLRLSSSLYDRWFKEKLEMELATASEKLYTNFDKLVKHCDLILNDKEYYQIRLPFLKSTILYRRSIAYPLGKLLESWMSKDDLEVKAGLYMIKINISPLSGFNNYTAYSKVKKALVTGSLKSNDKQWEEYFDEFTSFTGVEKNANELLVLTRLLDQLSIA